MSSIEAILGRERVVAAFGMAALVALSRFYLDLRGIAAEDAPAAWAGVTPMV
ncbi:hypothetical protein [Trinickia terrae]|uniref:hypothetical protein n=1 Tax=Trinickia terrae TaxID=2571161 RepID=UPI00146AFDED|nr:hypothetical protein [Trinickia terrae]